MAKSRKNLRTNSSRRIFFRRQQRRKKRSQNERGYASFIVFSQTSRTDGVFRNDKNVLRGSKMIHIISLTRRKSRSQYYPLPRTWTRFLLFALMILCLLRQVRPISPTRMSAHGLFHVIAAPVQPETILREIPQSSPYRNRDFVVDREGEMPIFAKSPTFPTSQPDLPNPNEFRQSMSSTPVSVASFPTYDAGTDEIPRSRSLDPIKVTRAKKGTTGKKKRTAKPEVQAS